MIIYSTGLQDESGTMEDFEGTNVYNRVDKQYGSEYSNKIEELTILNETAWFKLIHNNTIFTI